MLLFTPADLEDFGRTLYGDDWAGTLAARLKVSRRTINRWRDGDTAMPVALRAVLEALAEQQIAMLEAKRGVPPDKTSRRVRFSAMTPTDG